MFFKVKYELRNFCNKMGHKHAEKGIEKLNKNKSYQMQVRISKHLFLWQAKNIEPQPKEP